MNIDNDFDEIIKYAHFWNWLPDWDIVKKIYKEFPDSYSILTPFAYSYLEELIRSTTSEYGKSLIDKNGNMMKKKVGIQLIKIAIKENDNQDLISLLREYKKYFRVAQITDSGDNRNSVDHGFIHPISWTKESFEQLIHDIARISKFARF